MKPKMDSKDISFIDSSRGGRLLCCNQYIYRIKDKKDQVSYWKCRKGCNARVTLHKDVFRSSSGVHNHPPEPVEIAKKELIWILKNRVANEPGTPIPKIFREEISNAPCMAEVASTVAPFKSVKSGLYKERQKAIDPPILPREGELESESTTQDGEEFVIVNDGDVDCIVMECREITIPIPGRNIAAKEWGPVNGRPILALHGWQDNASTFDALIPLLSPSLRIVAIDFTGHGLSDHKPRGYNYQSIEHTWEIKPIVQHLDWKRFTILAHSMGAATGMVYASLFPDEVVQIVNIDTLKPPTADPSKIHQEMALSISTHWELENKLQTRSPVYSEAEALRRMVEGSFGSLTESSAKILMSRGARKVDGGIIFTRDLRLKGSYLPKPDIALYKTLYCKLQCELIVILAAQSFIKLPTDVYEDLTGTLKKSCSYFELVRIEGTHHVHLNNPERVAPYVNKFLLRYKEPSKL